MITTVNNLQVAYLAIRTEVSRTMVVPSMVLYTSGPKMATLSLLVLVLLVVAIMSASIVDAQTSLTEADKQLLLNLHNRERSQANPSAANMEMMVWLH